jgi:hypothetical protein
MTALLILFNVNLDFDLKNGHHDEGFVASNLENQLRRTLA